MKRYTRVSTDPRDSGYRAFCVLMSEGRTPKVYLNGKLEPQAITADSKRGTVRRAVTNAKGELVIDRARIGVLNETVCGKVRIVVTQ